MLPFALFFFLASSYSIIVLFFSFLFSKIHVKKACKGLMAPSYLFDCLKSRGDNPTPLRKKGLLSPVLEKLVEAKSAADYFRDVLSPLLQCYIVGATVYQGSCQREKQEGETHLVIKFKVAARSLRELDMYNLMKFGKTVVLLKGYSSTNKNPNLIEGIFTKHQSAKPLFAGEPSVKIRRKQRHQYFVSFSGDKKREKNLTSAFYKN